MTLSTEQKQLRDAFIDTCGYWAPMWEDLLIADVAFFESYLHLASVPFRSPALSPKFKELVHISIDAAATHMFLEGTRLHIKNALSLGASAAEIMEVLELTATLGIHACTVGVPILVEELEKTGVILDKTLTPRQMEVKAAFEQHRGYWNSFWDDMLALDAEFFDGYTHYSSVPWLSGVLSPKEKELIYSAFDVAATHMYLPGLRQHIANALRYGATKDEIMEVFEIASTLGIHAVNVGLPILIDELAIGNA